MKVTISHDARPQAMTLLVATAISILLWFIPFAELLTYPFRLFVTFIHEGGHAIAALLTGNSVARLSVSWNTSGETYTTQGGLLSQILVSSSGYLAAMVYGALLLVLIRRAVAARVVLIGSAAIVLTLTLVYGLLKPLLSWGMLSGIPFTLLAGISLSAGLIAAALLAKPRLATFLVSFLAVQCILNAVLDLKTVFFLSTPLAPDVPTDAANMANVTGIPAMFWVITWIVIGFVILSIAMRLYVVARDRSDLQPDLPFEEVHEA